jgi:hypothetical protein
MFIMKRAYWYLIVIFVVALGLLLPLILQAQPPDKRVPPPPLPGEVPIDVERQVIPSPATPTPNPIEAKNLPRATPPVQPPMEMIDTAPDVPYRDKYQLIIKRGQSGEKVVILVPLGIDQEQVLKAHLNPAKGDELIRIDPPPPNRFLILEEGGQ